MPAIYVQEKVYNAFYTQLTSDAYVIGILRHTVSDIRIGKANAEAEPMPFRCLTYEITDEAGVGGTALMTANILTVVVWTGNTSDEPTPDVTCEIAADYVKNCLHGFGSYDAQKMWEIMPLRYFNGTKTIYDKDMESWYVRLQFKFNLRIS